MFGMSFPAFALAVLVFIALCAFLGYVLPRLSGDDGRRPIEDSDRLSFRDQTAPNEIADHRDSRMFTACGHDLDEPNPYGCPHWVPQLSAVN